MSRNPFFINGEGYTDTTVGKALQNILRDSKKKERMEYMSKKRNCRRTDEENRIHEKAVKLRKMSDEQLVKYVESIEESTRSEEMDQSEHSTDIDLILDDIGRIRGIGTSKLADIRQVLEYRLEAGNE